MSVTIVGVEPGSPAARAGLRAGEALVAVNGHFISDVLDYRFYVTERLLRLDVSAPGGEVRRVFVSKGEYEELGLEFETYLMDRKHSCKNKCVFCFVDQMPPGMRETLYFKDDDERLSFLFGSYITLTNLSREELQRITRMHISPVNVSVHTTDPALRVEMMKNPGAGRVMEDLALLAGAGIALNVQLVVCPGLNDGEALRRTLADLETLFPALQSVAAVPVGLTRYRQGLFPLRPFTREEARDTIGLLEEFGGRWAREYGRRAVYPSDEFFLLAGLALPGDAYYEEYPQLENGVGLLTLLEREFDEALARAPARVPPRRVTIATGEAAFPLIRSLARRAQERVEGLWVGVVPVQNDFFGGNVTVAGLLTGADLRARLEREKLWDEVLIPAVTLRHERDRFLDDVTLTELCRALGVPVRPVENDGAALLAALLGIPPEEAAECGMPAGGTGNPKKTDT